MSNRRHGRELPVLDPPLNAPGYRYTCPHWETDWLYREIPAAVQRKEALRYHLADNDSVSDQNRVARFRRET